MKILFVSPYFGFSGVVSDTLAGHLASRGHEIVLVGHLPKQTKPLFIEEMRRLTNNNISFQNITTISASVPGFVTEFPYFLSFEEILKKINPDIVHINCLPFLTSFQAARISKKCGKKTVLQVHGVVGGRGRLFGLFQEVYNFTVSRIALNTVDRVICLTSSDAEKTVKYGCPPDKIRIIPNGVDSFKYRPMDVKEDDGLLLWCGRFIQQKGLENLIVAFRYAKEKQKRLIKLIMTGDGPLLTKIHRQVQKSGLGDHVTFLGCLPREDIPILMNKASIYVLPSLYEGMPYVLLEAMACGTPVVGTDISGITDVINHLQTGLIVPPKNPEALADAIITLLEHESLRKKLSQNARELMVNNYSWNKVVEKVENVYSELIGF